MRLGASRPGGTWNRRQHVAVATLAGLVLLSFGVRLALAAVHVTPHLLPDEYIYAALARGIAETGLPTVRGEVVWFPALLQPLLTAPFWLADDIEASQWLIRALNALCVSSAAIPLFALTRRLGAGSGTALACAALGVTGPGLLYASYVLADPVAYPLVLAAVYAAVLVLERPSPRREIAFLALAGFATFARLQYAVLPLVLVAAAVAVERGRLRHAWRHVRLTTAVTVLAGAALFALSPDRVLGPYASALDQRPPAIDVLAWAGSDLMLLLYAAGVVLVPGALVGLSYALARPRTRAEGAFALVVVFLAGALVVLAALVAAFESDRVQERYLIVLPPLVAPAFALSLARWRRAPLAQVAVAAGLAVLVLRLPVTDYLVAPDDSPTLLAVHQASVHWGLGTTALAVAVVANLLLVVAGAVALTGRGAAPALAAAALATGVLSFGSWALDGDASRRVRATALPDDVRWVDRTAVGSVTLMQTPYSSPARALQQLYWNRTIDRVALVLDADPVDRFPPVRARIGRDGTIAVGNEVVRGPLLVATSGSTVDLAGATLVRSVPAFDLWRATPSARVEVLTAGRAFDGWLAPSGSVTVWPGSRRGTPEALTLALSLPPSVPRTTLEFTAPNVSRTVRIGPGQRRVVTFPIRPRRPWNLEFRADRATFLPGRRAVSVRSERPLVRWTTELSPPTP